LRAGALPAPVNILEERTVGPSLGQDSIDKGLWSTIIGGLFIVVFMVVYYKMSGLVANMALLLNIIIILGALAAFHATLTLPGIAGIVLTIGMAVDANVLIFERIREELRAGKTARSAIDAGYSKAFLTILDSNVTTLIAALFLFQFGTGPVKGFAVTLSIGLVASMFTAIFITRIIFDYFVWNRKVQELSI
ncbi:MAG TPA: protein translocase subunit SecD, partial [Syntrophales bacterium]|nr:protein translocase subunit SecD [Syntrophales bacterium]